ncbi:MAG: ribonuclease HII [Myxococcota bacterium]|nr:ribonuclease HII [Myxococcota bacterium]
MKILGLDEAGRGCVLGPLTVGAYCCEADNLAALAATGATDSKALSAKRRQAILKLLPEHGTSRVLMVTPAQIDAGNINTLEEEAFLDHIRHFKPDVVYLDAPVHPRGIPKLKARMVAALAADGLAPDWVIEPKADANYPVVGAASIAAKVLRDAEIKALGPVGSGYPSDPVTRKWLLEFIRKDAPLPACVRTRWGTIDKLRQQALFG